MGWGWGWGGDAITLLEVAHMLYATPRQRWCVNFRFLYVIMVRCWCVHVYRWYIAGVSCAGWGGVGVGMQSRFWKLHTCCMLITPRQRWCVNFRFFYVIMVHCWCVHVYTWYVAGVSCAGWGGVGAGMQSLFWKLHTCCMLRHGNVGV